MLTRRSFLTASSLLALAPTLPVFLARTARAADPLQAARVLVVVQLDGGNDALNTVVPHADPEYAKLRPGLKLAAKDLIKLNDSVSLHPSLRPLSDLLEQGRLAVIPGVTYPNPNRSHFRSMAIWQTAKFDPEEHAGYGWLGRALDATGGNSALVGGGSVPATLRARRSAALSLARPEDLVLSDSATAGLWPASLKPAADSHDDVLAFVRRQAADGYSAAEKMASLKHSSEASYPSTRLAERLRLTAGLLKSDLGARVYYTLQSGYDTHAAQRFTHANLLSEFAGAVRAFYADLDQAKLAERVLLVAFSEFGRTIKENGSNGTDHGTTGCVFVAGPKVKDGLIGAMPSLTDLDQGEPKMTTDFRRIYATLLDQWLNCPSEQVLGAKFEHVPLL
jgi:uncharacterized protein (DUF1501 family)